MACIYTIDVDGKPEEFTLYELTEHYYKTVGQLKNRKIFSSEEVVRSTFKDLAVILNPEYRQSFLTEEERKHYKSIDKVVNKDAYTGVYNYISKSNEDFLNIGLDSDRLSPEYIVENRIVNFIIREAENNQEVEALSNIHPEFDKYRNRDKYPRLGFVSDEALNYYLTEVKDLIAFEEKVKDIGNGIHKVMAALIETGGDESSPLVTAALETTQTDKVNDVLENFNGDWKKEILKVAKGIFEDLDSKGKVLSEVFVVSRPDAAALVSGNIDAIVIDEDGTPHIYDFKVSKRRYEQWDTAKLRHLDWQLAFYRQLLGQHTDVRDIDLNVVAIELSEGINGYDVSFNIKSRLAENKNLQKGEKMQRVANKLIPITHTLSYEPGKIDRINDDLKLLFSEYKVKLNRQKEDFIEWRIKAWKRGERLRFENSYSIEGLEKGTVEVTRHNEDGTLKTDEQMVEEFTKLATLYTDYLKENQHAEVGLFRNKLQSVIRDETQKTLGYTNEAIDQILKNYTTGNYKLVKGSDQLTSFGIVLLENKSNGNIVAIDITAHHLDADYNNSYSYSDIEYIKVFKFLDEFSEELGLDTRKVEDIVVLNIAQETSKPKVLHTMFDRYMERVAEKGVENKLTGKNLVHIVDHAKNVIHSNLRTMSGIDKRNLERVLGQKFLTTPWERLKLEELYEIQRIFLDEFDFLKKRTLGNKQLSFSDEVEYVFALLSSLIVSKQNLLPEGDFVGMKDLGIEFSDFKSIISALFSKNKERHDKAGDRIVGLMGGMTTSTPDKIESRDLRVLNKIYADTNLRLSQQFQEQSFNITPITKKYFENLEYSGFRQTVLGDNRAKFKNFWVRDSRGRVSSEWMVKNPYAITEDNDLLPHEIEFLKPMLFEVQKYLLNISDKDAAKIDITSMESIERTAPESMKEAIRTGRYFQMPLIRTGVVGKRLGMFKDGIGGLVERTKEFMGDVYDFWDQRELTPEDRKVATETSLGIYEMYDVYSKQDPEFKAEMIEKRGVDNYELDLDAIAHRVAFSKIRKRHLDKTLPLVNALIWSMKLTAGREGADISKQIKYIEDRHKLAATDEPIIQKEWRHAVGVIGLAKRITSMSLLAFRPVLLAKELTIGMFKGFNIASTQMFGKDIFNKADLAKAIKIVFTIDKQFSHEFSLIQSLNRKYMIANMDVNTIAKKMQTNRSGIALGLGRYMFSTSTMGDFYNRLSLFVAKMIHDGSFEAHSMNDVGKLLYDPTMDERFKHYFEVRDKYMNKHGQYIQSKTDNKYNEQRSRYLLLIRELNEEREVFGEDRIKEKDKVDQAYSGRERRSFKILTDTSYGYYDKEFQSHLHHTVFGVAFLQFLQFWPGKMHLWFGKPTNEDDPRNSPITKIVQKKVGDKLVYRQPVYEDPNNPEYITDYEETFTDTGDPWLEVVGEPQEGLVYSIFYTLQDIFTGKWDAAVSNEQRMARVYFALGDSLAMMVFFGILVKILQAWLDENGSDGIDGETMAFMYQVNRRVLTEANIYKNTLGAIRSEPAFFTFGQQVARGIGDTFQGNSTIQRFLGSNIAAIKDFADV